jgi:hypothetical protein
MLENMKNEISVEISKICKAGKVNAQELENIIEVAVSKATISIKDGLSNVSEITKEAVKASVEELEKTNNSTKENIDNIINTVVSTITKNTQELVNEIDMELLKTKYRFQEKEDVLSMKLKDGIDNAIKTQEKIYEEIVKIVKISTENALEKGKLNAQKIKEVSEATILVAIEIAQKNKHDMDKIIQSAIEGLKEGIISSIEKVKIEIINAKEKSNTFIEEEIKEIISDLESLDNSFKESLLNVANKVNNITEESIRKNIAEIKDSSEKTISEVTKIVKGAISGMINGAKDAMKKDS